MNKLRVFALGLMLAGISHAAEAQDTARCEDITLNAEQPLSMGLIRGDRDSEGFIGLDPQRGISMSNDGASHQGGTGAAVAKITGLPETTVRLFIQAVRVTDHNPERLAMAELLVEGADNKDQLSAEGEEIEVTLPNSVNQEGLASTKIRFGARFRYGQIQSGRLDVEYMISVECVSETD